MQFYAFWDKKYLPYIEANLKPKTVAEYRRLYAAVIGPAFDRKRLSSLTTVRIEKWHLTERKRTPVQANRALAVLSSCLQLAARWGEIPANPARGIKAAKEAPRERYLSSDEVKRLMAAITSLPMREKTFILLALYTGARPGELKTARWSDILPGPVLSLPDSKTGRRQVYLSSVAKTALDLWWHTQPKNQEAHWVFGELDYRSAWNQVRKEAGLENARLYDLRHTFASAAISAGQTLEVVSQLLGHKNPQTTRRYAHLTPETGLNGAAAAAKVLEEMGR